MSSQQHQSYMMSSYLSEDARADAYVPMIGRVLGPSQFPGGSSGLAPTSSSYPYARIISSNDTPSGSSIQQGHTSQPMYYRRDEPGDGAHHGNGTYAETGPGASQTPYSGQYPAGQHKSYRQYNAQRQKPSQDNGTYTVARQPGYTSSDYADNSKSGSATLVGAQTSTFNNGTSQTSYQRRL